MPRQNWTREELIVAFNLYCKTPFAKINSTNITVIDLAKIIGRTPSALALKLVNFARLDPALQERGISGMSQEVREKLKFGMILMKIGKNFLLKAK